MTAFAEFVRTDHGDPDPEVLAELELAAMPAVDRYMRGDGQTCDELLSVAEAAKVVGLATKTLTDLIAAGDGPWTLWAEDVARWARARSAVCQPGQRRAGRR